MQHQSKWSLLAGAVAGMLSYFLNFKGMNLHLLDITALGFLAFLVKAILVLLKVGLSGAVGAIGGSLGKMFLQWGQSKAQGLLRKFLLRKNKQSKS